MIIQLILFIVIQTVNILFSWLPAVDTLPLGLDSVFVSASMAIHGAMDTVPYIVIVWQCFLYALGFEILLKVLKVFLGSRVPAHTN